MANFISGGAKYPVVELNGSCNFLFKASVTTLFWTGFLEVLDKVESTSNLTSKSLNGL